ncbi:MAG TPA: carbon-phosphorus lyase complex subunit PhnI [Candidatus Dormibacteraeota bacterium]|jgi:alpha-D-ribose 1-methylphosphonate 5-triphosphate synthase subunit PhnI|nr:carbon-phosphorus lyase complex subunit PhnI [Candidatus Dormibacteraeota bacterium]
MYTTILDQSGAVAAAARLAREGAIAPATAGEDDLCRLLPLLVDQVTAEAGVFEPRVCARALREARGDAARAVSLVRAWAATLPRLPECRVDARAMRPLRRITPAFADPPGGQYLGATLDYAQRLLDLDDAPATGPPPGDAVPAPAAARPLPAAFPRALGGLEERGLVAEPEAIAGRTGLRHRLCRAETGAMTALAYSGIRGYGQRSDPTLVELRQGMLPLRVAHPDSGEAVHAGEVAATLAEVVLYRVHDGHADPRLSLGVGATCGRVERRAISAALLDANCARAAHDASPPPCDDREFLSVVLDGQEAAGFVEHLKLPHHVTFTSDLERLGALGEEVDG